MVKLLLNSKVNKLTPPPTLFDTLQVAIAQFSDDARTEFQLSSHSNKEALLEAIQKISYKGGNTKTGLDSILMYNMPYVATRCSSKNICLFLNKYQLLICICLWADVSC